MYFEPRKGTSAYDNANQMYVPFPTETDALLAGLLLVHEIPRSTVDIILAVVNQTNHYRSRVTLKSSLDIYTACERSRILMVQDNAAAREHISRAPTPRSIPATLSQHLPFVTQFPFHVMENVMEFIHEGRVLSLDYIRHRKCADVHDLLPMERGEDLLSLSLVHRTWTFGAQRVLGRIALASLGSPESRNSMMKLLRSPCFGPWTREIILSVGLDKFDFSALELLQRFLLRFRNIKVFILKVGPYGRNWLRDYGVEILRRNKYLQTVAIQTFRSAEFQLSPLLDVLNGLRYLNSLEIGDCMAYGFTPEQLEARARTSSPSPRAISMTLLNLTDEMRLAALAPVGVDNKLLSLSLQFGQGRFSNFFFNPKQITHLFRDLQELRFPPRDFESLAIEIIPLCPCLSRLHLDLQPKSDAVYLETLQKRFPASLEHLGFHFVNTQLYETEDMDSWDIRISELVSRNRLPALRSIEFESPRFYERSKATWNMMRHDKRRLEIEARHRERSCSLFPRTSRACSENMLHLRLELCLYPS